MISPKEVLITLRDDEAASACRVARKRLEKSLRMARMQNHAMRMSESRLRRDMIAAVAQKALAHFLEIVWHESLRPTDYDLDGIKIRSTDHDSGCLIAHPNDRGDTPLVLAVVRSFKAVRLCGWLPATSAKQAQYWRDNLRNPAYFVPQARLFSIWSLKSKLFESSVA